MQQKGLCLQNKNFYRFYIFTGNILVIKIILFNKVNILKMFHKTAVKDSLTNKL